MRYYLLLFSLIQVSLPGCRTPGPPEPYGPLPSDAQWEWQQMEMNMFVHFNINTFTDREWGTGAEEPGLFNPTDLDTDQWAQIARAAGMKGIIITAKHHDGFCLWPSEYTEHSVKNSPWRNGQGDVLKDLSESCKKYGLRFGVYLSPWDRNHADYGKPEYLDYFRDQMRELFMNYAEVFEFWIDGANGGTGYYGGANEERRIDRRSYYNWSETFDLAYEMNPRVIIFSDGGPGCRWIGNEEGWAGETNWSLLRKDDVYPGYSEYQELPFGHADGDSWIPGEVNVSMRPGWYYHEYEDHQVKSPSRLVNMYYESVGRNGLWLLNFPVDRTGKIHHIDSANILEAMSIIREELKTDLANTAELTASDTRGKRFSASYLTDELTDTYWATGDSVSSAYLELSWEQEQDLNMIMLQEYIPLGQRIEKFEVFYRGPGGWVALAEGTTIGYKRILRTPRVKTGALRIELRAKAPIALNKLSVFNAPTRIVPPEIRRYPNGDIFISAPPEADIMYALGNNSIPKPYTAPIHTTGSGNILAYTWDSLTGRKSSVSVLDFGIPKSGITVSRVSSGDISKAYTLLDEDPETWWHSGPGDEQEIELDLGGEMELSGITYLPMQGRYPEGFVSRYEVWISSVQGGPVELAASGEFSNIKNNPIEQRITFRKKGRFIRFRCINPVSGHTGMGIAELGVITEN